MSNLASASVKKLGELVEVLDHLRVPINSSERYGRKGAVPYYGANGLQGWIDKPLFNEPLILLAEDGGNFDDFATRPIAYRIDGPSWVNNHAHVIRAAQGVNQDFLFWALVNKDIRRFIAGGTRTKLNQSELRSIEVWIPDFPEEQSAIANILDTLDTQIRQTEAIIAKLQQVKQGLLHDLLTRGIDANGQLRPPRDQAPELYKESPLGWIPRKWEVSELQNLAEVVDPQPDHRTPPESKEGVPYVGIGDVDLNGNVDTSKCRRVIAKAFEKQKARFVVRDGDIIFGKIGTIGQPKRLSEGDYAISANVVLIQPKVSDCYIYSVSESEYFETQILDITNTTSQPALGIQQVRKLLIPMPGPEEVFEIGERMRFHSDRLSIEVEMLNKLKKQKSGLMDDLLTGRVRVTSLLDTAKAS